MGGFETCVTQWPPFIDVLSEGMGGLEKLPFLRDIIYERSLLLKLKTEKQTPDERK